MKKELILFLMILLDWTSHILETFFYSSSVFQLWKSLIDLVGYNLFWITYWGIALLIAFKIYLERK